MQHLRIPTLGVLCILCSLILYAPAATAADSSAADRPAGWAEPVTLEHSDNFFRVTPELYRSSQPDEKAMRAYAAFGIKTVLNLRGFHSDSEEAAGTSLALRRVPIHTWNIDEEEIVESLALIITAPKPVLVHCMHGADRTGLVVAVWRVTQQGWTKQEAKREMMEGGFGFHTVWANIPTWLDDMDTKRINQLVDQRVQALGGKKD